MYESRPVGARPSAAHRSVSAENDLVTGDKHRTSYLWGIPASSIGTTSSRLRCGAWHVHRRSFSRVGPVMMASKTSVVTSSTAASSSQTTVMTPGGRRRYAAARMSHNIRAAECRLRSFGKCSAGVAVCEV